MGLANACRRGQSTSWDGAHEFTKVVDRVTEEGGNAKIMRTLQPFLFGHIRVHVDACEVQE